VAIVGPYDGGCPRCGAGGDDYGDNVLPPGFVATVWTMQRGEVYLVDEREES